ncbi:DUF551 domain-containing protein [Escherichia coli]|nr:DUF551 domain-containing protein [Escherichia coli]MDN1403572.1 DUF551 domain-containing protein [Escherichia coli]MDN1573771.1 DUF551 domain-containing protein [Escherichia coli]QML73080.1 DUF551 domain-containing protein [Escherichia coli]
MTTITRERLLTIKQWRETYGQGSNVVLPAEEAEELARIALASLEAEPVAWKATFTQIDHEYNTFTAMYSDKAEAERWVRLHKVGDFRADITPIYTAKPVPVVPGEIADDLMEKLPKSDAWANGFRGGWNSCRAVMLQSGNFREISETSTCSPVILAGWISCSERMPEKNQNVLISVNFDSDLVEPLICSARYTGSTFRRGEATIKPGNGIEQATHWMPLPEPPQEVNRG